MPFPLLCPPKQRVLLSAYWPNHPHPESEHSARRKKAEGFLSGAKSTSLRRRTLGLGYPWDLMTRTKVQSVYPGLSSPCLTVGCLSVQGGHWSETDGCFSLMSHPKLVAPLPCSTGLPLTCLCAQTLPWLGSTTRQNKNIHVYPNSCLLSFTQEIKWFLPLSCTARILTAWLLLPLHQLQGKKKKSYRITKMSQPFSQ